MSLELFCINPFIPSAPFFHLLKTLRFYDVFRGRERVHWEPKGFKKRVTINCHNFQGINYSLCSCCQISNQAELILVLVMLKSRLIRKLGLLLKFMTSQIGQQIITIQRLLNTSRSNVNQT